MTNKAKTAGFYLTAITILLSVVGLIAYVANCKTAYYAGLGTSGTVVGCIAAAAVCQLIVLIAGAKEQKPWMDILPVAASALTMVGVVGLLTARVTSVAAVMTFENNAQNMADTTSLFVAAACLLVAVVLGVIASFFDMTKD